MGAPITFEVGSLGQDGVDLCLEGIRLDAVQAPAPPGNESPPATNDAIAYACDPTGQVSALGLEVGAFQVKNITHHECCAGLPRREMCPSNCAGLPRREMFFPRPGDQCLLRWKHNA